MKEQFMLAALEQAKLAVQADEVPIGAVLVRDDKIIARAHNQPITLNDPTAHAEILALRQGAHALGNYRLNDCDLYVTLEPCPMCAQAISFARLSNLIFSAEDPKSGGVLHGPKIFDSSSCHHKPNVIRLNDKDKSKNLLQKFFKSKRKKG